ncbi:FG-GAP repeat protein [Streptomyces sp. JL1001]|uniref:FG-GAP repeat protein n=1 Tax=Streptomyces sp. JL1001 TaxID=3078227 RepID=A0AAU8KH67_9ACTN
MKPKWITQATAGVPGADEQGDAMGASAAVGDVDGDGYGEVVVGLPGEDVGTAKDAGGVLVFKGSVSFGEASLGVTPSAVRFGNWLG